jgi:uncharacterized protein
MEIHVEFAEDPWQVWRQAGDFLIQKPVRHNLILTLLHGGMKRPEAARYWTALAGNAVVGVALQSPLDSLAHVTRMETRVVAAMVEAIANAGISLPGVRGDAATAASFAGQWAERLICAVKPYQANRLYQLCELAEAPSVSGQLQQALPADRTLMLAWTCGFHEETGELPKDIESQVDLALGLQQLWLWNDGQRRAMAWTREPVAGVVRVSRVYTPLAQRKRGYAQACVHALSKQLRDHHYQPILYTDLSNPTSNAIYRRIGYRALAEVLRYRFG